MLFGNGVTAGHVPVIAVPAGVVTLWAFGWGAVVAAPWVSCRAAARVVVDSEHKTVELYDLTDIAVRHGRDGVQLLLTSGSHPSTATLPLGLVEANPALWDLVYLGIRHSVAGGAHIDQHARQLLRLPTTPGPSTPSSRAESPVKPPDEPTPCSPRAPAIARPWRSVRRVDATDTDLDLEAIGRRHGVGRARNALRTTMDGCLP